MPASISIREHIQWLPDAASEPTSTVVVTSSKNRFVDIRILKPNSEDGKNGDMLHPDNLDWAFAGTSSSSLLHHDNGNDIAHTIWTHWIDSRTPKNPEESVKDEGDMLPQADGTTLERGRMVNPTTGKLTQYEEVWRDIEPVATTPDEGVVNAVLLLHDDEREARGMVVRVGQWCQAFLRVGEALTLERWKWEKDGAKWKREARMGNYWVPCGVLFEGWQRLQVGKQVKYGEFEWRVVELDEIGD